MTDTMTVVEARAALQRAGFSVEHKRLHRQFILKRKNHFVGTLRVRKGELSCRDLQPWIAAGEKWQAEHA